MKDIVFIDNENARLVYHPDTKIVHHTLLGSGQFREVLDTGIEILTKYKAHKWLSDDRGIVYAPEDLEWSRKDWRPRAYQAGWRYWGLVVPNDLVARVAVSPSVEGCHELGIRVMVFNTLELGMEWLCTVDKGK